MESIVHLQNVLIQKVYNEIDSVCILREMIEVRERRAKCDIFNNDDVEFIINNLCLN